MVMGGYSYPDAFDGDDAGRVLLPRPLGRERREEEREGEGGRWAGRDAWCRGTERGRLTFCADSPSDLTRGGRKILCM
jgi:hypothetical protein